MGVLGINFIFRLNSSEINFSYVLLSGFNLLLNLISLKADSLEAASFAELTA